MERAGHTVVEAREGDEGIRLCKAGRFDVVITDLIMPGKEGLETIRELKAWKRDIRIIAMSGGGRLDTRDYLPIAKAFGAVRLLEKPFTEVDLQRAIDEAMEESR